MKAAAAVPSPCINVCRIDDSSKLCVGCLRTLDEIAAWGVLSDDERRDVWTRLAFRAARIEKESREAPGIDADR